MLEDELPSLVPNRAEFTISIVVGIRCVRADSLSVTEHQGTNIAPIDLLRR